jgi:acetyl-CoA carboxylase biotin carboxyl carrier protein
MDLKHIKDLIDAFAATELGELSFSEGDCQLRLVRRAATIDGHRPATDTVKATVFAPAEAVGPEALDAAVGAKDVVAPLYGVLHLAPSADEPPFVKLGDPVRAGQTLGVLEAMKMFHTLKSTDDGVVGAILAVSGGEVAAGQVLFRIT